MAKRSLDYDRICELYESGMSTLEIAEKLGCSKYGVRNALISSGVRLRTGAKRRDFAKQLGEEVDREFLLKLMESADSAVEAAKKLGVKYTTFVSWLERFGIPRKRWRGGSRMDQRRMIPMNLAIEWFQGGVTYHEIADRLNVSYDVVRRRMEESGYEPPRGRRRAAARKKKFANAPYEHKRVILELGIKACEICDEDRGIDLAHIVARKDGGPTCADNSLVLCPNHHRFLDRDKLTDDELAKIKRKVRRAKRLYGGN